MAVIRYHAWWPGITDPFYQANITENRARINYYGADYTPHFRLDGIADGDADPDLWPVFLNGRTPLESPLTMDLVASYDPGTRQGQLTTTITNVSETAQSGRFHMALTESGIYFAAPNGELWHEQVMRDMVPDAVGVQVSLDPAEHTDIVRDYYINPSWVADNCELVVFVQAADREILQGARVILPLDEVIVALAGVGASEQVLGDDDGSLDPGEAAELVATVKNIGYQNPALGVTGVLATSDPYLTIVDGSTVFGDIPGGNNTADNAGDPFTVELDPSCPFGHTVVCSVQVSSTSPPETRTFSAAIPIGTPPDYMGPDGGGYYAYENTDAGFSEIPTYDWVEIDPFLGGAGDTLYMRDEGRRWIRLPFTFQFYGESTDTITVSANGWISFKRWFLADPSPSHIPAIDGPPGMAAGMWCDLNPDAQDTSDAGGGRVCYYEDVAEHRYVVEFSEIEHYGSSQTETFQIIVYDPAFNPTTTGDGEIVIQYKDVTDPASCVAGVEDPSETMGLEYSFFGYPNCTALGIVSERAVRYTTDPPVRTSVGEPVRVGVGPVALFSASPNPFRQATTLRFRLPEEQRVALRVYGIDGRLVCTLREGRESAGTHSVYWNGLNEGGHEVASGVYFARLEAEDVIRSSKLLVVR